MMHVQLPQHILDRVEVDAEHGDLANAGSVESLSTIGFCFLQTGHTERGPRPRYLVGLLRGSEGLRIERLHSSARAGRDEAESEG
jgi:hypothetical protein